MRILLLGIGLFIAFIQTSIGQSTIIIDGTTGKIHRVSGGKDSSRNKVVIVLPQTNFQNLQVIINDKISLAFSCPASKTPNDTCYLINAADIVNGEIVLQFDEKVMTIIGSRPSPYTKPILTGKDQIKFRFNAQDKFETVELPFVKPSGGSTRAVSSGTFSSSFCETKDGKDSSVNGKQGLSFLCQLATIDSSCKCGVPVASPFNNVYLPACVDKNGNAISVTHHILYDMSAADPLQKAYLFDIKKGKYQSTPPCPIPNGAANEYASVSKRIKPKVDQLLAVSLVAHKDSVAVIDSNFANYFQDSAAAVEKAFTAAAIRKDTSKKESAVPTNKQESPVTVLQSAVTLSGDLVYFNNSFKDLNFLMQRYISALTCLQLNIVKEFKLTKIPVSGEELAMELEEKMKGLPVALNDFACRILTQIVIEYNTAINKKSNYRTYTRVFQVPNADEFTVGMRTSKDPAYVFRYNMVVKGGLKLDFSTGVFLTGLNNRDYILSAYKLRFKDSANATAIKDTSGTYIQKNRSKLNFSTGFLVHIYPRSGCRTNYGMVTGVTFNNSEFMMVVGGSAMFRMGSGRLSVVGGFAFGKRKALDANHQKYYHSPKEIDMNKIYIKDEIPRFFPDTNISTYDKLQVSWFAGISYNFASIKL